MPLCTKMSYETLLAGISLAIIPLMIWEAVWKGIAMWKAAKNNKLAWFICIFIFNTLGILPILYIFVFSKMKGKKSKKRGKRK